MLLRFFNFFGGKTFATGVTTSLFHTSGHLPLFMDELIMFAIGFDKLSANSFNILEGMSPGGIAFLTLISFNSFRTLNCEICGIEL